MTERGDFSAIAVAAAPFTKEVWALGEALKEGGGHMLHKWDGRKWIPQKKVADILTVDPNGMPVLIDTKRGAAVLTKEGKWTRVSQGCTSYVIFGK